MRSLVVTLDILAGLAVLCWFLYAINRDAWQDQARRRAERMGSK